MDGFVLRPRTFKHKPQRVCVVAQLVLIRIVGKVALPIVKSKRQTALKNILGYGQVPAGNGLGHQMIRHVTSEQACIALNLRLNQMFPMGLVLEYKSLSVYGGKAA